MNFHDAKYRFLIHPRYLLKRHVFNQLNFRDYKKILHYFWIILKNKLLGYPRLAIIETGTTCNLQCPTCPTPRSMLGRPSALMHVGDFKKIIDHLKDAVHVVLLYNTNEPLLHPHLSEMINYADSKKLYTMISTNATLLNRHKTDELLNSGLDEILLCLDGMSKAAYEPFRQGARFDLVLENIKYFCEEKQRRKLTKPFTELQFIITKLNQREIPLVEEFAQKNGIDRLRKKSLSIGQYAYAEPLRSQLIEKFLPNMSEVKNKYIVDQSGKVNHKHKLDYCNAVDNQISVLVDGRLALCCYDIKGEYIMGDLMSFSFKDIWRNNDTKQKIKIARKRGFPLCDKCEIF